MDFELFKSEVCHEVKRLGEVAFVNKYVQSQEVQSAFTEKRYDEAFYLLAMIDYLSKRNMIPLYAGYREFRRKKLASPLFPRDVLLEEALHPGCKAKEAALQNCNPEFLQYNIIEGDVFDVV